MEQKLWSMVQIHCNVSDDYIFLYGYTLEEAELLQISTGKLIATYPVHEGATFAYAVKETIYVANGKENTVTSYDVKGNEIAKADTGRYPMSMIADHNNLYVINFKDTILSVYNINDLKLVTTWEIPTSSHGLHLVDNELWVGGHGAGSQANKVISKYNIQSGECGAIQKDVKVRDVILAQSASTDSTLNKVLLDDVSYAPTADFDLLYKAYNAGKEAGLNLRVGNVFTADLFYNLNNLQKIQKEK